MKLTEHFTLEEMLRSGKAIEHKIVEQFTITADIRENLWQLAESVLEPLRKAIGKPIKVTSGYRCKRLNSLPELKGAKDSQHLVGEAADIQVAGMTNMEIIAEIKRLKLPVDQCIEEFGRWVHVSHRAINRGQYLAAIKINDRTVYKKLA